MQKLFSFFIALFIGLCSIAQLTNEQIQQIDSLKEVISTAKHDTIKISALVAWDNIIYVSDPELDLELNQQIIDICNSNLKIELNVSELKKFKTSLGNSYNVYGIIYYKRGNLVKALEYYSKCLATYKELGDKKGMGNSINNIGTIYSEQGNFKKALDYYSKSLAIRKEIGDNIGIMGSYNNIGIIYDNQGNQEKALEYYSKSLLITEEIGDKNVISSSYGNIGIIYSNQGNYEKALEYFFKSLEIEKEIGYKKGMGVSYNFIGAIYKIQGDYEKAMDYLLKSKNILQEINTIDGLDETLKSLSELYKKLGKYKQALEMHELYMETKDSIAKMDAEEELYKFEVDKEYQLKKQADSIKHADEILIQQAENLAKEEQLKNEKQRRTGLLIIVGLVLVSLGFVFVQLKNTRAQKLIIEKQHLNLNQSHKEITDSINYAKRIQDALMTSQVYMKDVIPQSFIFFQPKDVVSGDFYWVYRSPTGEIYFTVVDCTGHGVPGAFMSMIGCSLLNEMIIENNVKDTNLILDQISDKLKVSLEYQGKKSQPRDGMDMVLCRLNEQKNELMFTGAKNSLVLIRDGKVLEYKGDKRPVGYYLGKGIKFTAQKIEVQKNDMIYLFSDGFVDQFGGERNKKYMSSKFKKFLLEISDMPTKQQEYLVKVEFTDWIGGNEQIDDVCVMGVRI